MRKIKSWKIFNESVEGNELKCLKCDADLQPENKFCKKCGTKVGTKDERSFFSQKIQKVRDMISHKHELTKGFDFFSDSNREKTEEWLSNLELAFKDESKRETAEKMLDTQISFIIEYIDIFKEQLASHKKYKDDLQNRISKIEQEQIDLKNKNAEYNKGVWNETFKPQLDNLRKVYQSLKDKKIVGLLNDLFDIINKNFNEGKYSEAIGGASRLIITFFSDGKTFNGWNDKWTDMGLNNEKIVELLSSYKKIISEGK